MPKRSIDIRWPKKGLNESAAYLAQPGNPATGAYSTVSCRNVVNADPRSGRDRGGSRRGISKFCSAQVNGSAAIQCIAHVVGTAEVGTRVTADGTLRVTASGQARDLGPSTPATLGGRVVTLVAVAGGTAKTVTTSGVTAISSGTACLSSTRNVIFATPFNLDLYFADGANYKYYDVSADLMTPWVATAGSLPAQEANALTVTNATNATPIVITTSLTHGYSNGDEVTIAGVLGNTAANGTWVVASASGTTFSLTSSVGNGAYTSGGTSTRLSGSKCTLIETGENRIWMAGLETDPNNFFACAVDDPNDWDYSPDAVNVGQAFSGNTAGKNPDIITSIVPYKDGTVVFGGANTIHMLVGNPVEGGQFVLLSDITGMAFGHAWAKSPEGVIYFFGSRGGVYRLEPSSGGVPNRLTAMTIDERLADLDLSANIVTLEWDDRGIGIIVCITPTDGSSTTHYFWDIRNEAWWPFDFSNDDHNPFVMHLLTGYTSADRVLMLGGQDGYLRKFDTDATTDDGSSIESEIWLGPFEGMLLQELQAILSEDSGNVTWSIHSAATCELALSSPAKASGRFTASRNNSQWPRRGIDQGYLRLSSTEPWSLERIRAMVEDYTETARRILRS